MGFPSPYPPKKNFESGSEVTLMMSPQNHHRTIGVTCHGTVDWQVGGPKHCWWLGRWFSTHPPTEKQFQKWFQGDIADVTSEPPKNHRCHLPKPFWWVGGWLFPNGPNWVPNGPKWPQMDPNGSQMVPNGPR